MPGNVAAAMFYNFYYMFTSEPSRRRDVNDVIYDAESTRGSIWMLARTDMGSREGRYGFT